MASPLGLKIGTERGQHRRPRPNPGHPRVLQRQLRRLHDGPEQLHRVRCRFRHSGMRLQWNPRRGLHRRGSHRVQQHRGLLFSEEPLGRDRRSPIGGGPLERQLGLELRRMRRLHSPERVRFLLLRVSGRAARGWEPESRSRRPRPARSIVPRIALTRAHTQRISTRRPRPAAA